MRMCRRLVVTAFMVSVTVIGSSLPARAQVITATLYGVVHDSTGAILPGVTVVVTHQGTNLTRETVSDERGEFALPALPPGPYAIKIGLAGFKAYSSQGLALGAGQTVRQTYALEVGSIEETVTVTGLSPLVQTSSTAQMQTIGAEVQEIPVSRRNLQNVVLLAPGVNSPDTAVGGGRAFRVNGVGDGGSAITVDGSSAQTNPENRGFGNYGGQNQIEILSVESVAEVQVIKGVLAAEYGGSIGGQVNMITRSGTNQFHGSLLENFQSDAFSSRDPFLPATTAKPKISFTDRCWKTSRATRSRRAIHSCRRLRLRPKSDSTSSADRSADPSCGTASCSSPPMKAIARRRAGRCRTTWRRRRRAIVFWPPCRIPRPDSCSTTCRCRTSP